MAHGVMVENTNYLSGGGDQTSRIAGTAGLWQKASLCVTACIGWGDTGTRCSVTSTLMAADAGKKRVTG